MGPEKWLLLFLLMGIFLAHSVPVLALTGNVELLSPDNESWTNETNDTLSFSFIYTDPGNGTAMCYLFINTPGAKGSVSAANDTQGLIDSDEDFVAGENEWWITCSNGSNITSETRTFFSDRESPAVNLISPSNQSTDGPGITSFTFIQTDSLSSYASCDLLVNGTSRVADSVLNSTETSWDVSLGLGTFEWHVSCSDNAGNVGDSGAFWLNVWTALSLSITSPENDTYGYMDDIPLTFMVSGSPEWMGYSLDGGTNVTVSGNTTFDVDTEGQHSVEVYANDSSGNMSYDVVHFTVRLSNEINILSPLETIYQNNAVDVELRTDRDVEWCGISLDGGSNVSMDNYSARSWFYNLTGLSEGDHDIVAWCEDPNGFWTTDSTNFTIMVSVFVIDIMAPLNKTYWDTTGLDILVTLNKDASVCEFYLDSEGPMVMYETTPRTWYYNITMIHPGSFRLNVICNDSLGFYNHTDLIFTVKSEDCETNEIGICSGAQECIDGSCVDVVCDGCRYAANHTCHSYECCLNEDCLEEQSCSDHQCIEVVCFCGEIADHSCIEYECCSNFDCDTNQFCDTSMHKCVNKAMVIDTPPSVLAGETFTVRVKNQDGDPIEGVSVTIIYPSGGRKTVTTDNIGVATLVAIESGTIQITAEMSGYDTGAVSVEASAAFNWLLVIVPLIILIAAVAVFFYWQQLPPLVLVKMIRGQNVTLKVKNTSSEHMGNVLIIDTVPSGAFISCEMEPRVESFGGEDHITWFAALNPREQIMINYQAVKASDRFMVKVGEDEYHSGYGFIGILQDLIKIVMEKLLRKKKKAMPPSG
jgi:hypothetical protein